MHLIRWPICPVLVITPKPSTSMSAIGSFILRELGKPTFTISSGFSFSQVKLRALNSLMAKHIHSSHLLRVLAAKSSQLHHFPFDKELTHSRLLFLSECSSHPMNDQSKYIFKDLNLSLLKQY